jgi:predicted nucleic acid-binding protein
LKICFDASFLFSLYAVDAHTESAVAAMARVPSVRIVTHLTELELRNSLQLRVFRGELNAAATRSAFADWQTDLANGLFELRELPENWIQRSHAIAKQFTPRLGTRTLDLIHVAAALELEADALYSFDDRQRHLARELKLKVN